MRQQRDLQVKPGFCTPRAAVVVERELELLVLAGDAEEVVRRLPLAVPDDVHVAPELQAERFVEGPSPPRIGDPEHRVQ
jgi:hypothetical protein